MFWIVVFILIVGFLVYVFYSIKNGVIYVPSLDKTVEDIVELSNVKPEEKTADLGSGDGRIVIAMAKAGAQAYGYEINPFVAIISKIKILFSGQSGRAHIYIKSFFDTDLSQYDVITIFMVKYMMKKTEEKVLKDAKKGTKIIVESFPFESIKYKKKKNSVYLYEV